MTTENILRNTSILSIEKSKIHIYKQLNLKSNFLIYSAID